MYLHKVRSGGEYPGNGPGDSSRSRLLSATMTGGLPGSKTPLEKQMTVRRSGVVCWYVPKL